MNRWGIPKDLESQIRERDRVCVYCGVALVEKVPKGEPRLSVATWEHIINDARIVTLENIARCCNACNASKGAKELVTWLKSDYCKRRGIDATTVADVVQRHLDPT